jgi:hypothetical protein
MKMCLFIKVYGTYIINYLKYILFFFKKQYFIYYNVINYNT